MVNVKFRRYHPVALVASKLMGGSRQSPGTVTCFQSLSSYPAADHVPLAGSSPCAKRHVPLRMSTAGTAVSLTRAGRSSIAQSCGVSIARHAESSKSFWANAGSGPGGEGPDGGFRPPVIQPSLLLAHWRWNMSLKSLDQCVKSLRWFETRDGAYPIQQVSFKDVLDPLAGSHCQVVH